MEGGASDKTSAAKRKDIDASPTSHLFFISIMSSNFNLAVRLMWALPVIDLSLDASL